MQIFKRGFGAVMNWPKQQPPPIDATFWPLPIC